MEGWGMGVIWSRDPPHFVNGSRGVSMKYYYILSYKRRLFVQQCETRKLSKVGTFQNRKICVYSIKIQRMIPSILYVLRMVNFYDPRPPPFSNPNPRPPF